METNLKGLGLALSYGAVLLASACNRRDGSLGAAEPTTMSAEAQRAEAQRTEAQWAEAQRAEAQRVEAQRAEAQRVEAQRVEAQRVEAQRAEAQRAEASSTMAFNAAIDGIAEARCQREQRCNHIGVGRRYESVEACRTVVHNDFSRELNPADCRGGVDRNELNECVREVREENCRSPLDTLQRLAACRTSDLCNVNPSVSAR